VYVAQRAALSNNGTNSKASAVIFLAPASFVSSVGSFLYLLPIRIEHPLYLAEIYLPWRINKKTEI
jgi:hypothetical protein